MIRIPFFMLGMHLLFSSCSASKTGVIKDGSVGNDTGDSDTGKESGSDSAGEFSVLPGKNGGRFVPIWQDEFDGAEIDPTKWRVADENPPMDFPYRRNWKPENVYIEDGALVIRTVKETDGTYSAGAVRTGYYEPESKWQFGQAFGRFEARIKPPSQQGHWAAFWLFTPKVDGVDGSGRDGTEIDIVEFAYVNSNRVDHALHWDGYEEDLQSVSHTATGIDVHDNEWHTFVLEWYPDEYIFYVDGTETWRTDDGGVSQVPQYIKLTEEIGNYGTGVDQWGSGPIEGATLPDHTRIDYVRVWAYQPSAGTDSQI